MAKIAIREITRLVGTVCYASRRETEYKIMVLRSATSLASGAVESFGFAVLPVEGVKRRRRIVSLCTAGIEFTWKDSMITDLTLVCEVWKAAPQPTCPGRP